MSEQTAYHPESLMMSYGYKPELSEGSIKCPVFQTSTFVFKNAEAGKAFFELAYGLRTPGASEELGLIYSRLNNPDLEILENRLKLWDGAADAAVFESGLAAITTVLLEFLSPGDVLLHSAPLYGGTDHFIKKFLPRFNIRNIEFYPEETEHQILARLRANGVESNVSVIYIETPANPTGLLIDIEQARRLAEALTYSNAHAIDSGRKPIIAVDNTYLGPVFQRPLRHGADLVLYSATKYIGGHSDLIAGACLGSQALMTRVKGLRTFLGNMAAPYTGWLLLRSLETLKIRMECQAKNAVEIARFLKYHPKVAKVYYPGFLQPNTRQYDIFMRQCTSAGGMLSFDVRGGEKEAFRFLNALKLIKLAVSLGSTESLASHPHTMTHADVSPEDKMRLGISEQLVRLSIGVENPEDLISDIAQALEAV